MHDAPEGQTQYDEKAADGGSRSTVELSGSGAVFGIIDPDYGRVFTIARLIAWQEGFALCAQGSFTRDLDLLAVPWTEQAKKDTDILARRIAHAAGLEIHVGPCDKPHGRKAWTLMFPTFGDPRFVDLSIMTPNAEVSGAGTASAGLPGSAAT